MTFQSRSDRLLSLINVDGYGLEIGPGFNPLLPKARGFNVETVDHGTRDELVRKYKDAKVDTSLIEVVDHVVKGRSIFETIGREGAYDYVVASHVIEHTPDMLGFLLDCQRLLKPAGVLALAVPDKRFSFDVLRPVSTTGDVLQAHAEKRTRHSPGRVFDEGAYNVLRGGEHAWHAHNRDPLVFFRPLSDAFSLFERANGTDKYIDIHAWQFTPSSFRLIVSDLHEIGVLALREQSFYTEGGGEFIVSLSAEGKGVGIPRLALAQEVIRELRAIAFE
jgi:SAM-dependent methyltransferase